MASNDLLMRIQLLVDAGKASTQLKQVSSELRRLNTEISNIRSVRLTGLADDTAKLRTQLVSARNINLAPLNTQLAGFESQLLASTTASAGLSNSIKSISNLTEALKQVRIQPIAEQIKNANTAFRDTSKLNLIPLQNNLRSVEQRLLQSKISAQQAKIAINALKEVNPNAAIPQQLNDSISQYKKDLPGLKNEIDKAKLAISQETSSIASNNKALITANQARRAQIATIQSQISANNARVLALKQQLIAEQQSAAQIKNNIGLTQAQITAQKNASIAAQRSIQLQIAQKQQEVSATKSLLASRIAELKSNEDLARGELSRIRATNGIANQAKQVRVLGATLKQGTGILKQFGGALAFALGPQVAGFAAAGAVFALVHGFVQTNKEIENLRRGLNSISDFGGVLFSDLNDIADRTGQSILNVSDSFLQLTASAQGTNLEGAATRQIFEAVSNALVITGADAVRSRRAFLALAQMMSKGQVYAEELRQQLSEALPGAVNIFSRALDIAPSKLLDLMKQGKVSSDALILFMEELKRTYKPIPQDLFTISQKSALLQNSMLRLFTAIGDTGIWRSFGNSLISAKNYIDNITSGVAEFSDNITTTYEYLKELDSIVGVFSTISNAVSGISGPLSGTFNETLSIIASLPETLSRVIIELKSTISNAGLKLDIPVTVSNGNSLIGEFNSFDKQWTENVYALIGKTGQLISDIFNKPYTIPTFEEFSKGNETLTILKSRLDGVNNDIQILNDKSERFGGLNSFDSKQLDDLNAKLIIAKSRYDAVYNANLSRYNSFVAQKENENKLVQRNVENAKKEQDAITKAGIAYEVSKKNAAILRDLNKSSLPIFSSIQRSVEQITNISKANEKSQLNKIEALKEEQKIEDDIFDINQKQKKSGDDALKNRLADSRTLLEFEVERGNALKEAERNSKTLSEGRAATGVYFTPEQKKASEDEEKARQLKIKALDIIEQANKSNSEIEQRALRDNAKYLLDQSNELYKSAGNTYDLGQGLDEVKKILEANSKVSESDLNNAQGKLKAEREYGQAVKFFQDAEKSNLGSLATEYRKYALEKAKSAAAGFADIGDQSKVDELNALLIKISEKNLQVSTELDDKIQAALARSKKEIDPELVIKQLGDLTGLLDQYKKAYASALSDPNVQQGVLDNFKEKITSINNDLLILTEKLSGTQFAAKLPATIDIKAIEDSVKNISGDLAKSDTNVQVPFVITDESKAEIQRYIEYIGTLTPQLRVQVVYDDPGYSVGGVTTDGVKRALGGSIPGYGGGDRVRALLEPGEFVLRKEAVRSIGLDQLIQMNRLGYRSTARSVDNLAIPRFAGGGSVSGTPFVINIGGRSAISGHVSNRDQAKALADILTKSARSL